MAGLWRNQPETPEGKYLVKRRDGTIPEWPYFVLGARDPIARFALLHYADEAERLGMDKQYVLDIRRMAYEFEDYRIRNGDGRPDGRPHRTDDPETVAEMAKGKGG